MEPDSLIAQLPAEFTQFLLDFKIDPEIFRKVGQLD